jgi:hypothetical protein
MKKIAWIDSVGLFSYIHATKDGIDTVCKGHADYIMFRKLSRAPNKRQGITNYCSVCFRNIKHNIEWDSRCANYEN